MICGKGRVDLVVGTKHDQVHDTYVPSTVSPKLILIRLKSIYACRYQVLS